MQTNYRTLKKRIEKQIKDGRLLCDVKLSAKEFGTLTAYVNRCVSGAYKISERNAALAVFLVAVGQKYYDGAYWEHVEEICGAEIPYKTQLALGDAFYGFAAANGIPVFSKSDRVKNIMAQCFLPEFFEADFFRFLFYGYFVDLKCDITRMPKTLGEDFISAASSESDTARMGMITRGTRDFISLYPAAANRKMRRLLLLTDKLFRLSPLPLILTRQERALIAWCERDETFRREATNANFGGHINRNEAFSAPFTDEADGVPTLWLPAQFFRYEENADENIVWSLDGRSAVRPAVTVSMAGIQTEPVKIRLSGEIPDEAGITYGETTRKWVIIKKDIG
jgi:hypothetical protein